MTVVTVFVNAELAKPEVFEGARAEVHESSGALIITHEGIGQRRKIYTPGQWKSVDFGSKADY